MRNKLSRSGGVRALLVAAPVAALLVALLASGSAGAAEPPASPTEKAVIDMVVKGKKLAFEGPETVYEGQELEIFNDTNPRQVGPHTFSLVEKGTLPKTKAAQRSCFTPGHICMSIAKWHGFNPKTEKISINPVKAGPLGWSTMGNNKGKKGDSWFTGETKKGTHTIEKVTAKAGTTLYFVCAIHPWMQGSVEVVAPPSTTPPTS
ncbi:MAG: hypothetical protein AB7V58_08645 [Solirubrobacterales bacterium]